MWSAWANFCLTCSTHPSLDRVNATNCDILCVIPARGGSTRVPNKNIAIVGGQPLINYTLIAAQNADVEMDIVVSTDSPDIAKVAAAKQVTVIDRPASISTGTASTESVLIHALTQSSDRGKEYSWVMTLPPTSPFRSSSTIDRFMSYFRSIGSNIDCLMTVTASLGDYWLIDESGIASRMFKDAPRRQQDRKPIYEENSAIYLTRVSALRKTNSILGDNVSCFEIDKMTAFDINDSDDLQIAEALSRSQLSG